MILAMNPPKCNEHDYINFLIATQVFSCSEAGKAGAATDCLGAVPSGPAHDAYNRLLYRLEPNSDSLWDEACRLVNRQQGVLILDDTTLDKLYSRKIELVGYHWSGKHHRVVKGISLVNLVWSDGDRTIPCDYRIYDSSKNLTKNDHFLALLEVAAQRGFQPRCVLFDGWYSSLDNLKRIRDLGWRWLTRFKKNRQVNRDRKGLKSLDETPISPQGTVVHLKGYGLVKVFRIDAQDGDAAYWATNDLEMNELERLSLSEQSWAIEEFHRGLKQNCGVEKSMARKERGQRNHIGLAIRAFLRLEWHRFSKGVCWAEAKTRIARQAVRAYMTRPLYLLPAPKSHLFRKA